MISFVDFLELQAVVASTSTPTKKKFADMVASSSETAQLIGEKNGSKINFHKSGIKNQVLLLIKKKDPKLN